MSEESVSLEKEERARISLSAKLDFWQANKETLTYFNFPGALPL